MFAECGMNFIYPLGHSEGESLKGLKYSQLYIGCCSAVRSSASSDYMQAHLVQATYVSPARLQLQFVLSKSVPWLGSVRLVNWAIAFSASATPFP